MYEYWAAGLGVEKEGEREQRRRGCA